MEYLNIMYNIMKTITCSVVPQANVASNLPIHVNPSKRRKLDQEVDKSEYRLESVRLKSFEHWPCSWITGKSLAAAGFYYTGTRDKVKCFECDIELMEWEKGADPMIEHKRWSARCRLTSNISRLKRTGYVNYDDRYASFGSKWPEALSHLKKTLAAAGLFYTGNLDETICFQCGGELRDWELEDDPWEKHAKHHQNCFYVRRAKGSYYVNQIIERMRNTKLISPAVRQNDICRPYSSAFVFYTGIKTANRDYNDYYVRYASFGSKWPEALSDLKETLAAAGLFYTGNLDETICFECGGGLRDWKSGDDPWEEHAKHHQNCSYLRIVKGNKWVNEIIGRMRNSKLETVESSTNDKLDEHFKEADNTSVAGGSSQNPTGSQNAVIESTGFGVASAEGSNKEQSIATTSNKNKIDFSVELCKLCGIRKLEIMLPPCEDIGCGNNAQGDTYQEPLTWTSIIPEIEHRTLREGSYEMWSGEVNRPENDGTYHEPTLKSRDACHAYERIYL